MYKKKNYTFAATQLTCNRTALALRYHRAQISQDVRDVNCLARPADTHRYDRLFGTIDAQPMVSNLRHGKDVGWHLATTCAVEPLHYLRKQKTNREMIQEIRSLSTTVRRYSGYRQCMYCVINCNCCSWSYHTQRHVSETEEIMGNLK